MVKKVLLLFPVSFGLIAGILFLTAGSLNYWQAWFFLAALFIPLAFTVIYFLKFDQSLLERRLRFKEKEATEKKLVKLAQLFTFFGFIVPGLDYRFGWSSVPVPVVFAADIIVFLSYSLIFFVFKENSYTSRIIEVEKGQKLIDTGPYAIVRHPMYVGTIAMYFCIPLSLGSIVSLAFFIPSIIIILLRIFDEERVLLRDLPGYKEYTKKVKYRLIPKIW